MTFPTRIPRLLWLLPLLSLLYACGGGGGGGDRSTTPSQSGTACVWGTSAWGSCSWGS